ncbi:hypothetical protein HK096_006896 [Nowakowskiella sp. JEL0078]|nr:hypothetical protein HK096_006896 [Nowakowskiella sp. JEL0078]
MFTFDPNSLNDVNDDCFINSEISEDMKALDANALNHLIALRVSLLRKKLEISAKIPVKNSESQSFLDQLHKNREISRHAIYPQKSTIVAAKFLDQEKPADNFLFSSTNQKEKVEFSSNNIESLRQPKKDEERIKAAENQNIIQNSNLEQKSHNVQDPTQKIADVLKPAETHSNLAGERLRMQISKYSV